MSFDRGAAAVALAALLLVAACGGAATSAPGGTTAPATVPPAATVAPTLAPAETPAAAATDAPSGPGAAADLEALLPGEVNGITFQKASFDGATIPGGIPIGGGEDELLKFLEANGKSIKDLRVAIASPVEAEAGGSLVMALQVEGLPSDKLMEFVAADMQDQRTTVAGKEVYGTAMGGFGAYVYPKDDVVFYVLAMGGESLAEDILAQLP